MDDAEPSVFQRLMADDEAFVRGFDAAVGIAVEAGGDSVACRIGCVACCIGPFDITSLDAERLRHGLHVLSRDDRRAALEIVKRARHQWQALREEFPGDGGSGVLGDHEDARVRFFTRFESVPCPVLDEVSGRCLLYPFRPLSCRSFGVPILCGNEILPPCGLNFVHAPPHVVRSVAVDPDPHEREKNLERRLVEATGRGGETIVTAALAVGTAGTPVSRSGQRRFSTDGGEPPPSGHR